MEELPQVTVSGAVLRPGQYPLFDNMSIVDLVTAAGNLKRSAYLDMAELTRYLPSGTETKVERYEINLANALNGQPQNNMKLEPNDHLIIRSIPDYQDRFMVKVSGAVLFPGALCYWQRGDSLFCIGTSRRIYR